MRVTFGCRELEVGGDYLGAELRDSRELLGKPAALRQRLEEEGYLLIRGLHPRQQVLEVRREILEKLGQEGKLDPAAALLEGVVAPHLEESGSISVRGTERYRDSASFRNLVQKGAVIRFFEELLEGPVLTFNFQWLRIAAPGVGSNIHADVVFMGRGTPHLYTCWTPLGDLSLDMGPLALYLGSHRIEKIRQTYGRCDVDRDRIEGHLGNDPVEMVERWGGRWATTSFQAGDVLVFGMYLLHASLTNTSRKYRLSVDARYQRADEPVDERWAGEHPCGHETFWKAGVRLEPYQVSRKRWGI